ncbi:COX assembly mitochondrial protein homolog [Aricia agestis]|uniref:COX assembly mitochondrial protein homolog n=1 Tax=Aricia agestis TaxID=91739 RepID=UPI001C201FF4|nr:COX assembly mitochondrial protein homolog [Aricia agestis]
MPEASVLPKKFSEGPHGLGDPNDKSLRKVEEEVLIPKLIRDKAKTEKCVEEVANFNKCCKESSVFMVVTCRKENSAMKSCLADWYNNEDFRKECTQEYLNQRSHYRSTGIKKPVKRA